MTSLSNTPYYGGGQVPNPANVLVGTVTPNTADTHHNLGTIYVDEASSDAYMLVSKAGGTAGWAVLGGSSSSLNQLTGDSGSATPTGGAIKIAGGTNMNTSAAGSTVTVNLNTNLSGLGTVSATGTITTASANVGGTQSLLISNTDASNPASNALLEIQTVSGGGDPYLEWQVGGLKNWVMGIDASDTQSLKISNSAAIGTTDVMRIDSLSSDIQFSVSSVATTKSAAATNVTVEATNSDNTSGTSNAYFQAAVGGASSGDAAIQFQISGGQNWTVGLDNSASDALVVAASNALGTSNVASWTTSGQFTTSNGATITTGPVGIQNGNLTLGTAGNKLLITTGSNASVGQATLSSGTVTVSTTAVTASSLIYLTRAGIGTTGAAALGLLSVGTITAGTSFVINSLSPGNATTLTASDNSVINWWIVN